MRLKDGTEITFTIRTGLGNPCLDGATPIEEQGCIFPCRRRLAKHLVEGGINVLFPLPGLPFPSLLGDTISPWYHCFPGGFNWVRITFERFSPGPFKFPMGAHKGVGKVTQISKKGFQEAFNPS